MAHDELATVGLIDRALEIFRSKAAPLDGRLLNYTGDGAIAAFGSAASAITFALSFQEALSESSSRVEFRIGIHLGEVLEQNGRAYGDSINLAARLQSIAPPSGIVASDAVYHAVRGRHDFVFEDVGPQALKSFPEPMRVFRVHDSRVAVALKPSTRPVGLRGAERLSIPAVAVLPFRDLSDREDQGFFADGVADDILTNLSRFRGIDVISRGSSFAFKGAGLSAVEAGRRLGARYVVEGSIRRSRGRIRITVELADVANGHLIWAERYDRPDEDIFEIQDEVASIAVGAVSITMEHAEQQRLAIAPPDSLEAYGLVLKGTCHVLNYEPQENRQAHGLFERALDLSPGYARAYAALSRCCNLDWRYSWSDDRERSLQRALDLALKATEIGVNDSRGYAELGFVQLYRKEHDRSLSCYRRAVALNPNDANTIAEYGDALAHSGYAEDALPHFDRAMRLNPFYPDQYLWYKAGALTKLHRFHEAISCIRQMNNSAQGRRILACCYGHLGMAEEARREAEFIRAAQPGFDPEHWTRNVVPDRRAEDIELFVTGLRAAGL